MDMNKVIENVTLTKVCSFKSDEGSDESKQVTVKMLYDGLTLNDIFVKALSSDVIKWQASARKHYETFENGQTVEVSAKSPGGAPHIDPETAMVNKLKTMSKDEQSDYIQSMIEKATK